MIVLTPIMNERKDLYSSKDKPSPYSGPAENGSAENDTSVWLYFKISLLTGGILPIAAFVIGTMLNASESFSNLMFFLAILFLISGIPSAMISGFILLLKNGKRNPDQRQDLREFWSPAIIYLVVYAIVRYIHSQLTGYIPSPPGVMIEIGDFLTFVAFTLFFYFWTAGLMRMYQNRQQMARWFYSLAFLAIISFFSALMQF